KKAQSVIGYVRRGAQNVVDMWMGVARIVLAFVLIALIVAEFTADFQWLGLPFIQLLYLMQLPYDTEASEPLYIGYTYITVPSVVGGSIESEMTRFIIAALSVTQLIYMSEVGGVLLGSKVPIKFINLVIIFLLRTIITLPIIIGIAHLLF